MMNNINTSRPPLSPMSVAGSEWSGISSYKSPTETGSTMSRAGSSSGPSMGRSSNTSPPSSVARSSDGMRMYNEDSPNSRPPRMPPPPRRDTKLDDEQQVARQHAALKTLLEPYLNIDKNSVKANKARDKLLRLTKIQFQELSTDVYDELQRRQGAGDRLSSASNVTKVGPATDLPEGSTPYLMPRTEFHPKRNQARQKLSTLPTARFRDLATDVFYELERRYPQFTGGSISRTGSPASSISNGNGRPIPAPLNPNGMPRPNGGLGVPGTPTGLGPGGPGGAGGNSLGRPLPKTFQSNPGPPNKPGHTDDDDGDDDEDEDAFGFDDRFRQSAGTRRGVNGRESLNSNTSSTRNLQSNEADKKLISDYQSQVSSLQKKLDQLEFSVKDKDREIERLKEAEQNWKDDEEELRNVQGQLRALQGHNEHALENKTRELSDLKHSLETKLVDAQNLNSSLQNELARLRSENDALEDWQQSHVCQGGGGDGDLQRKYNELLQLHENLKGELREQQETTEEVRRQAMSFLNEMKQLTANGASGQSHEQMMGEIESLRNEVKDWKARYTKAKTQIRTLKAASIGLQYATEMNINKAMAHSDPNGLVKDIHITKLQLVVDEILRSARIDPKSTMQHMKTVAALVKAITKTVEAANPPEDILRMSMKVSATGHNLITAIRNHAMADGISPVSLVDAATSHLTAAVVDMAKKVKIRPTPSEELENEENWDAEIGDDFDADFLSVPVRTGKTPNLANGYSPARTSFDSVYSTSSLSSRYSNQRGSARNQSGTWGAKRGGFSSLNPLGINSMPKYGVQEEKTEMRELREVISSQNEALTEGIQRLLHEMRQTDVKFQQLRPLMDEVILFVGRTIQSTENALDTAKDTNLKAQVGQTIDALEEAMNGVLTMKLEFPESDAPASREFTGKLAGHCFAMAREAKALINIVADLAEKETEENQLR
ncbi:hypothetical protein ABW19_dt0205391 [Dactylella cylindrospora]|nr:hypothetical protein ABW19_dt0205391 [Dactylella cylindrospora]